MREEPTSKVQSLLDRMSLEEKVAQLGCVARVPEASWLLGHDGLVDADELFARQLHGVGQIGRPSQKLTPYEAARFTNSVQQALATGTTHGIGALFNEEGVHGHMAVGGTSYPSAIALASTWDPDLVERVYQSVAREVRARGSNYVYAPVLDLARDARWGRVEETFGEDPYLVGRIGVAAVRGLQGGEWTIPSDRVLACVKHFAGHGTPEAGINAAPLHAGEREFREEHLAPFAMVLTEAPPGAVMAAYHEVDGIPCHASSWLLQDVLRDELAFAGMVSSDGFGVPQLVSEHRVAGDRSTAARIALESGIDCEVPEMLCFESLVEQVREGSVAVEVVERAAGNVLAAKERLGLLEGPVQVDPALAEEVVNRKAHRRLALEAARRSAVLLTNDRDTLPLDRGAVSRLAVIGPNARGLHLGGYTEDPGVGVTLLDGLRQAALGEVTHADGYRITEGPLGPEAWWIDHVELYDRNTQEALIEEAVDIASNADVAVVVLGGNEGTAREGWASEHLGDRDSLEPLGSQLELLEALKQTDVPLVGVVMGGRPLDLRAVVERCSAVLQIWYPGQEGGTALGEIIFGDVVPSGRMTVTLPGSVGQIPVHARRKPSSGRGYLFAESEPLFPLGHGLSYTSFEYGDLTVEPSVIAPEGETTVTVDVCNTGDRSGAEVVQCYVHDCVASITRPLRSLRGFQRVEIEPGEVKTVAFSIGPGDLALVDREMKWVVEPGVFEVYVGDSSAAPLSVTLTVE